MKLNQDNKFRPIYFILETKGEKDQFTWIIETYLSNREAAIPAHRALAETMLEFLRKETT